ncbi:MAG: hypothetical protein WKG52_04925 [Variovorax sp.]
MQRATRDKLVRLHRAVIEDRRALGAAREQLIEALGDWLCGSGAAPTPEDIEALEALHREHSVAQARHAAYIAGIAEELVARARGSRPAERRTK